MPLEPTVEQLAAIALLASPGDGRYNETIRIKHLHALIRDMVLTEAIDACLRLRCEDHEDAIVHRIGHSLRAMMGPSCPP